MNEPIGTSIDQVGQVLHRDRMVLEDKGHNIGVYDGIGCPAQYIGLRVSGTGQGQHRA